MRFTLRAQPEPVQLRNGAEGMNPHRGRWRAMRFALGGGAALSLGSKAAAHTGTALAGGFVSGFSHPFSGGDHLLAMVSVGIWGAFLGRPLIYVLPVVFPMMMVCGAAAGMFGLSLRYVEVGIALSVIVLGGCIVFSLRAPVWPAALIVGAFALFHGYVHGKELASAAEPIEYTFGFVLATGLLHVLGIGIGFVNDRSGGRLVTRSLGGLITGMGVWFLCKAVAS